jgi:hypothetical protein
MKHLKIIYRRIKYWLSGHLPPKYRYKFSEQRDKQKAIDKLFATKKNY